VTGPSFAPVWSWDGPPRLAVERAAVSRNGRSWEQHRFVSGDGLPGVVIVPATTDRIAFIRIWRPTVDQIRLELPRGYGEGDVPVEDARRELLEETGLVARTLAPLGSFEVDTGVMPTPISAFLATLDETPPVSAATDGEADAVEWVGRTDLGRLLAAGEIRDAITLAALTLWAASDLSMPRTAPVGD
jgi:ADP-ribose pyrophosphatase